MTFWDRVAGLYDLAERANGTAVDGCAAAVAALVPEGASLLECAAGTGAVSLAAAGRAGRVLCTDLSQPMLDRARAKAAGLGRANIAFARRDLFHLPEGDGTFDVVCAANVLHLLDRPGDAVAELWRVTAPGGLLVLPTFLMGEAGPLFRALVACGRLLGFRQRQRFTLEGYRAFLAGLGLPPGSLCRIQGRLPVGLAVFPKPEIQNPEGCT